MNKSNVYLRVMLMCLPVFLSACAGSAIHEVINAHEDRDNALSCKQLETEVARANTIIAEVKEDKEDISAADWIDGILWFPFNLIAKDINYKASLSAADKRIEWLATLEKPMQCQGANYLGVQSSKSKTLGGSSLTELLPGPLAFYAEGLAKNAGCTTTNGARPAAIPRQISDALEVYDIECIARHMAVQCEYHICTVTK